MNPPAPEVSVLVVTHNAGRFLAPALASVLDQSGVELELILVDNASTDGSVDAALALRPDPRLQLVRLGENRLHAGGLKAGLPQCRAEFVALMDADDLSLPGRLRRQLDFLRANPAVELAGCLQDAIDAENRPLGGWFGLTRPEDILAYTPYEMPFPLNSVIARRAFFQRLGWREEFRWAHDYDFMLRATEAGRVACLPEVLYHYRIHAASVTLSRPTACIRAAAFVRLAAGRRRAARPEDLAGLVREHAAWPETNLTEAEVYERFGWRYLAEGFRGQAIMFGRRAWGAGRRGAALAIVLSTLTRTLFGKPPQFGFLLRLALLGPARALRVQSHPPLPARDWNIFRSHRRLARNPT